MKIVLFVITLSLSSFASAIDCSSAKVIAIQSQADSVLVRLENGSWNVWKNLGAHNDARTQSYQSLAQQAMAMDLNVQLRFPDGHDCAVSDYSTVPSMIRIKE
jgi:uncharacterized protein YdbL (DUF1318 family)